MFTLWFAAIVAALAASSLLIAAIVWPPLRGYYLFASLASLVMCVMYIGLGMEVFQFTESGSIWLRAAGVTLLAIIAVSPWAHGIRK